MALSYQHSLILSVVFGSLAECWRAYAIMNCLLLLLSQLTQPISLCLKTIDILLKTKDGLLTTEDVLLKTNSSVKQYVNMYIKLNINI